MQTVPVTPGQGGTKKRAGSEREQRESARDPRRFAVLSEPCRVRSTERTRREMMQMTEGNIPKKSAKQRANLRKKKAVRRHGDHTTKAKPKRKPKRAGY